MIFTLSENKELVKTIENIMQVLPEGVLVRCASGPARTMAVKYANIHATQKFVQEDEVDGFTQMELRDYNVKLKSKDESFKFLDKKLDDESNEFEEIKFSEFINSHEELLQKVNLEVTSTVEMVERIGRVSSK